MTPSEKAEAAKTLLESPILKAAFTDVRENLVSQLESVPFGDTDTQHEVALMLQLLKRLQGQLHKYMQGTLLEKEKIKQRTFIEKMTERLA